MAQVHPEKHNYQYELQLPILARVKVQRTNAQLIIICILTFLCCAFLLFLKPLSQSDLPPNPGFPSRPPVSLLRPAGPHLNWIPCSCPRFQCANLSVPLDYPNPNETRTASVALVRYLASNPSTETGTLIFNPGGPGGSGTGSTYRLGPLLDEILGGRYDVLGFDPRDINMPLPRVTCLQNEGTLWQMLATTAPSLHLHDVGIWDAVAQLMAEGYEADVLPFVNTPTVARDIAAIVDALHAERRHRVSYWGFSYGTNLGAIFVAMFPNKLHKIILDGIRSPFDAREVYKWGYTSLASLNDVVDGYFSICEEVGKAQCPLATGHVGGAKQKVMDFLLSLYKRPLPVYDQGRAGLVTFSAYKSFLYGTLYRPASWRLFAQATAHLLAGNGTSFFAASTATNPA
ncbi:hypothetical protein MMC13_003015 [Lambiella insularis]|nr:hypothetical protein [Lambiella insularis]